jgi:hypothetical protein
MTAAPPGISREFCLLCSRLARSAPKCPEPMPPRHQDLGDVSPTSPTIARGTPDRGTPGRRLARGSFLALLLVLACAALAAPPAVAGGDPGGDPPPLGDDWRGYVLAPPSRWVPPAAVLAASAAVRDPEALLARDGRAARLERVLVGGSARWPAGTSAAASSAAARHPAAAAIDGDANTWWQDRTPGRGPDRLTISMRKAATLPGVTLVSSSRGWVRDATVEAWAGGAWRKVGEADDANTLTLAIPFGAPVSTTRVRVTVRRSWVNKGFPLRQRELAKLVDVIPGLISDAHVDLDFGRVVAGRLEVVVAGASKPAPGVRLAVAELRRDLHPRSDYSHSDYGPDRTDGGGDEGLGTDQLLPPPGGGIWIDRKGCQARGKVCAEGVRGFRYARVYLGVAEGDGDSAAQLGTVEIDNVAVRFTPFLGTPDTYTGWFLSSDDLLNRAWYASVYTAELVTETFSAEHTDPRGCAQPDLEGKRLYLDGAKRDRCPYGGGADIAMQTSYVAHPDPEPITNQLHLFAQHQAPDGWIPGSPLKNFGIRYPDSPGRWVTELYKYALWSGDLAFVRDHWANLVAVLDTWYPRGTPPRDQGGGAGPEVGPELATRGMAAASSAALEAPAQAAGGVAGTPGLFLDNLALSAEQVLALDNAAELAVALGAPYDAKVAGWRARARDVADAINRQLWDDKVGAYRQSPGNACHPQWNEATVLNGIASPERAERVLDHLQSLALIWGNPYNDQPAAACKLFGRDASKLVYGEGGAYETLARFKLGRDAEAIDQIRRTYGWQLERDPGTLWEGWGAPNGDAAGLFGRYFTSMAHGHMAGAAFVLTNSVLGVTPTGFGFERYDLIPHPGDLTHASGAVPTPRGTIHAAWRMHPSGGFELTVTAPAGTTGRIGMPTAGRPVMVEVDGIPVWDGATATGAAAHTDGRYIYLEDVPPGTYDIVATPLPD